MGRFNPNEPYGTVQGCVHGRCFVQNHKYYDANGEEMPDVDEANPGEEVPKAKKTVKVDAQPVAPLRARTPADAQLADQLKG